ncbi:MAG: hypothetical protein RSC43_00310, partial [Clostridia bacterium]
LHGNKGVVGRIVPYHEMPFDENGEVPDIILNPLGVVSRNNLGQMVEGGLSLIGKETGVIQILPPFSGTKIEDIISRSEELGLVERDIYDGRTGRKFDKKGIIYIMHFLRLEHIATSKYNACSDGDNTTNQRTLQLNNSPGGGQRISELTTWCLNSYGADHLFDTLWTVQSDDLLGRQSLMDLVRQDMPTNTPIYQSNNLGLLEAYLRVLGINLVQDENGQRLEKLTSQQIMNLANGDCNLEYGDSSSEQSSYYMLRDPKIFGTWTMSKRDLIESRKIYGRLPLCCEMVMPIWLRSDSVTNLIIYMNDKGEVKPLSAQGSALMLLEKKLFISGWIEFDITDPQVRQYYNREAGISANYTLRIPRLEHSYVRVGKKDSRNPDPNNISEHTGIAGITELFMKFNVMDAAIYMDMQLINTWDQAAPVDILKDVLFNTGAASTDDEKQLAIAYITSTHKYKALFDNTVTDFMQLRNRVKAFAQSDCLVNFVVDAVIVPPIGYRPVYKETPATAMDLQLKSVVHTVKNLRRSVSGTNQYYDNMQSVFIALSEMIQAKPSEGKDSVNKTVLQELTQHQSKTSVLRDTLLSKRITHSGRSVISVDSKLKIGQAGIPLSIASKILEDHIIAEIRMNPERYSSIESLALGKFDRSPQVFKVYKKLLTYLSNNNIMGFVELSGLSSDVYVHFNDCKQELIQILTKIFKTMPVLLGREPSLHKFSIEGFQAIPVEGYAIKLHPLACHGFNADFDGDQMMVTFPIHGEGIKDVKTKMMMQDNLINPKDCELICAINQDMILGLYYATIFKNNAETLDVTDIRAYYNTQFFQDDEQFDGMKPKAFERLYEDVMLGTVHVQDTVLINHNGDAYCSTAGRILLNAMYSDMSGFLSYIEIDKSVKLTEQEAVYIKEYESRIALNRKDLTTGSTFSSDDSEEFRAAINRAALRVRGCIVHELLLDVTMMKDTVGKMSSLAIHYYGDLFSFGKDDLGDSLADFLNRIMNYGFWSADYSGITLSLYDFNRLPISAAVTATMPEVKETTSFIQQMYDEGMITEEERKSLNISEWNTLKRKLAGNIGSALKGSDNELDIKFDKMDNIYMIVASGSRGSTAQLMEISGIIGNVTNASNEVLETPITSNYMTGLSVSEAFNNSYTSRRQVMAAQLSTASAGEKTRKLIYMAENIHIRNSDTACSAKPTRIHLEYDVKLAFIEGARIQVEDTAPIPDEVYQEISEKLGKSVADIRTDYFEFSKHARESLETRLMDEDLKTLLKLTHFPFVIIQTASGYKPVFPAYKLTNKMRYMLLYRCINLDEFTDDAGYDIVREIQSCRLRVIPAAKYLGISAKEWRSRHDEWPAISEDVLDVIEYHQLDHVDIYTILGCEAPDGICMRCFGVKYDSVTFPDENEYIGYPAVQAIGEPTAQIVLDSHKSDDVGDGGSAISQLDQLLDKPGSICTAVVSSCDGEMQIRRDNGKIEIYVNGHKLGVAKNFDSLLVVPGTHVTTGTALTTGKVSYKEMSEHTDYKQVQVKFWRDFLDVFGNTKIMARNFEPIARSQSEFGVALETGGECTVGTLYPVQTLMENNVKYAPRILNQKTASNVRGKILTSISHSFFVQNATYHVVNHTKGLRESNIGRTLIGDLKTSPFTEPQGVIVPQPHKVFTQENQQKAAALLRMQRSVRSTRPSASKDAFTVDISGDTPVFTRVDELPQVNPVRSEVVIDFDEDIVEVGHEEKSNRFSK